MSEVDQKELDNQQRAEQSYRPGAKPTPHPQGQKKPFVDIDDKSVKESNRPDILRMGEKFHAAGQRECPGAGFFNSAAMDHKKLTDLIENLHARVAMDNPNQTPAQKQDEINAEALRLSKLANERAGHMIEKYLLETYQFEKSLKSSLMIDDAGHYGKEMRDRLWSMRPEDRQRFINEALENRESTVIRAIVNTPGPLIGWTSEQVEKLEKSYLRKHAPQGYKQLELMHQSAAHIEKAYRAAPEYLESFVKRDHESRVAEYQAAQERYKKQVLEL